MLLRTRAAIAALTLCAAAPIAPRLLIAATNRDPLQAAPQAAPPAASDDSAPPPDPAPTTEWHREPVLEKAVGKNVVLYNHADASFETATIVAQLQKQYDWLKEWCGFAPRWVLVHVGNRYPCGFSMRSGRDPEMFLQAGSIFDTAANYAHEMTHCFTFELCGEAGGAIPHWFNESLADMSWIDAEIALWKRRREAAWLPTIGRADYRSEELLELRVARGADYFPKVMRALWRRREECAETFGSGSKLDAKNGLIVECLSEGAGEDVLPALKEMGFDLRTRERQRGY